MLFASVALTLALDCAPRVAPDVLLSVAYAESHWNPLAIHDNVTGEAFYPRSNREAAQLASRLIAQDHNPDLGLLQINTANLSRTGLSVATAFDACASMHAGAQILLSGYSGGRTSAAQQAAILRAFSTYNTGSPTAGLRTYAPVVLASAQKVIPSLLIPGVVRYAPRAAAVSVPHAGSCEPAEWHYSADATCQPNASWHFSVMQDAAVHAADPAVTPGPTTTEQP